MKGSMILGALVLASSLTSTLASAEDVQVYHYGQNLDIAKVISTQNPQGCAVGEASMVYEDSAGEKHTLVYLRHGDDCRD